MDLPPGITLSLEDKPSEADIDVFPWALERFNEAAWPGHQEWASLGIFLRRDGAIAGGLVGETYCGWLFIRYVWLEEALRGARLGAGIIAMAETKARERGCHSAYVDSFTFQAPGFYEKQGYAEFGRLPYPPRGERVFLRKSLG
jgi:GNAT superfamily N-acetyltransferase